MASILGIDETSALMSIHSVLWNNALYWTGQLTRVIPYSELSTSNYYIMYAVMGVGMIANFTCMNAVTPLDMISDSYPDRHIPDQSLQVHL